jgi:hypothetical protein
VVDPCSDRISRVPPYSRTGSQFTYTRLSLPAAWFSNRFYFPHSSHWPDPRSLATTSGVSIDVLSCRYLDVSVPCVCFLHPILFRCRYLLKNSWKSEQNISAQKLSQKSKLLRLMRQLCLKFPAIKGGLPHSEIYGSNGIRTSP